MGFFFVKIDREIILWIVLLAEMIRVMHEARRTSIAKGRHLG